MNSNDKIMLTLQQLKTLVKENTAHENADSPVYFVKYYTAECVLDDFNKGEIGRTSSYWSSKDLPVREEFESIPDLLEAVCETNSYTFDIDNWCYFDDGRFYTDILVDKDCAEASPDEIKRWQKGEIRLWNCHIDVKVMKHSGVSEIDDSDVPDEIERYD